MKSKRLIVYGIGKFAEYVSYVFNNDSEFEVSGFCIEKNIFKETSHAGLPVTIFEDLHLNDDQFLFIAVGQNHIRKRIFDVAKSKGFRMATYLSSKAIFWPDLKIGQNSFITEGTAIQPFVSIGDNSIHFGSRIGHHTTVGDHTLLSNVTLGGNVKIGNETYLGMNSAVKQNVSVAQRNIIGMNVTIEENTLEDSVYSHKGSQKRSLSYNDIAFRFLK